MFETILKFFYHKFIRNFIANENELAHAHVVPVLTNINVITRWRAPADSITLPYMSPWTITHTNAFADVLSIASWNANDGLGVDCTSNLLLTCWYIGNRDADIVCLQDIPGQIIIAGTYVTSYIEFVRLYVNAVYHIRYHVITHGGLAILSKYPITNSGKYLTPDYAIYAYIKVNSLNYKIINCRINSQSNTLAMVPFMQNDDNKLPIQDMFGDILTQCYNNLPVIVCGRFAGITNHITKSHINLLSSYNQSSGEYDNILTNAKWCKNISEISISIDNTSKNNLYNMVFALVGLIN